MRLPLLSLLLLTAATSAIAAEPQPEERAERAEVREAREPQMELGERPGRAFREGSEAPRQRSFDRAEPAEPVEPIQRSEQVSAAPEPIRDVARAAVAQSRGEEWGRRGDDGRADRGWRERRSEGRGRNRDLAGADVSPVPAPVSGAQSGDVSSGRDLRGRIAGEGLRRDRIERRERWERDGWRRDWRNDRRYDWRRHRDWNRSHYNLGLYIDPFGWGYRNWDIGWRLPSRYFSSRYWIRDPWFYRLPSVPSAYRWIRYHDDVLLVDLRSGRVLDRIRNFFW